MSALDVQPFLICSANSAEPALAGSVSGIDRDTQLLADRARNIELHTLGVADEVRSYVYLDVVLADDAVRSEVLAFEVRVDRHVVLSASSTYWRDEVDRCDPALLLDVGRRVRRQKEFHIGRNPPGGLRIPSLAAGS